MPTIVFLLASVVAFSTGTSWGTMGILMPLVVPTAIQLVTPEQGSVSPQDPLFIGSIAGVLAGAIFGDHCSPISDTTVLSSYASGCDHVAHVRTQMPYALLVAGVSVVCGTIPIGFGVSVWLVLPVGVAAIVIWLLAVGRRCESL
jgi:Na+/H+ antiporter NhaC